MITLEQIANWNSQQNPLEKVLGQNSVSPCVTARGAGEDHSGMILYCDELKETTNLRSNYMEQEPIACEIRTDEGIRTFDDNCMGTLRTIDACGCKHIIEPVIYDDYNQRIKADQTCINTLTTNCGNDAERNGVKIIEYIPLDEQNKYLRQDGCVGTLTTDGNSPKHNNRIVEYEPNLKQQLCDKLIQNGMVQEYDVIRHSYSTNRLENGEKNMGRVENHEHLSPTLDTRCDCLGVCVKDEPKKLVKFGTYYTWEDKQGNINTQCNRAANEDNCALTVACAETGKVLEKQSYRIRKLTPKECGRLMGVKDEDIDKMSVNQSNSKLYHLYGDSIVVGVLCEIFKQML